MSAASAIAILLALAMSGVIVAGFVIAGREIRAKAKQGLYPCGLCDGGWSGNEGLPCPPCRERLRR